MGGVRILRNRKLSFSRLQGFQRTFNYSRQTHLRVMHLFFCGLKNNKFFEQVTKAENINCQKLAGINFCQNWFLTLSAKAMSNYNKICQHNGYIRQFWHWFCSFERFYPDSHKRLLSFLWYVKCPSQGWTSWTFYPFAPQCTVRRILCALTYCLWHALRLFLYLQLCFVPHK